MQKLLTFFFSKNISVYAIFNDQSFNDTLTSDIVVSNNWAMVDELEGKITNKLKSFCCITCRFLLDGHAVYL